MIVVAAQRKPLKHQHLKQLLKRFKNHLLPASK